MWKNLVIRKTESLPAGKPFLVLDWSALLYTATRTDNFAALLLF